MTFKISIKKKFTKWKMIENMIRGRRVYSHYARRILSDILIMGKSTHYTELKNILGIRHRKMCALSMAKLTEKNCIYWKIKYRVQCLIFKTINNTRSFNSHSLTIKFNYNQTLYDLELKHGWQWSLILY